ncbi:MAG: magnesium/cobalt transporter CorA [Coriobacteriia bacterium]|nr:magnesium/cobalt transporter CorA [Coriobacteriia bacterium]
MTIVSTRWVDETGTVQCEEGTAFGSKTPANGFIWVDVVAPDDVVLGELDARFSLHALALEDVRHAQSRPKIDIYKDSLFLAWLAPRRLTADSVQTDEVDVFIGSDYLITLHDEPNDTIDVVSADLNRAMSKGPDWLLHAIIDRLVDDTLPLVDQIGDSLEAIEDDMLDDNPRTEELRSLQLVRRQLLRLHRIVAPERDILRGLARESDVISEDAYRYFLDVGDHVARGLDAIETYQDVAAGVMDLYLSAQNNRMNEIMKQLTVVATIFMPLTLISGIYGMNIVVGMWPPPLALWSFPAVVGAMVVIAVVMAAYFRKRNWW